MTVSTAQIALHALLVALAVAALGCGENRVARTPPKPKHVRQVVDLDQLFYTGGSAPQRQTPSSHTLFP
jgi:hypothetical protein